MKSKRNQSNSKVLRFFEERGFYIVLFLCVAAIGISGYVLFLGDAALEDPAYYDIDLPIEEESTTPVIGGVGLEVPDAAGDTETSDSKTPVPAASEKPAETEPARQVVKIDTPRPTAAAPKFVRPVPGALTKAFSGDELVFDKTMADYRVHKGADYAAKDGQRVCAISAGTVTDVSYDELYGYTVRISHSDGLESFYCSLMKTVSVKAGQKVAAGDVIGGVGNTMTIECEEESHLHLELTRDGEYIDPETILPKQV